MGICFVRCRDGTELSIFVLISTFLDSTLFDLICVCITVRNNNAHHTYGYMNESLPSKVTLDKSRNRNANNF